MRNIFKDNVLQKELEDKGYIQLPLLDSADIAQLYEVFTRHNAEYNQPFHTSHFSTEVNYKRQVNEAVIKIVFAKLTAVLENCRPIFGNLMIKQGNSDYFMPLHADWTYVDEDKFRSIAVWIPLVDTNEENGCLGVIEGSHKVMSKIRGPRIAVTSCNYNEEWIRKFGKLLPVKAGCAIIYDHALMHYSPPNKSKEARPALNLSIVPAEADIIHYCIPEGAGEIEVYKVDNSEFYLNYNNYQRPETNSLIRKQPVDTVTWIDEKMKQFNPNKKTGFLSRFFG